MIKLQNDYFIDVDEKQYTLRRIVIREKKDTKEKYEDKENVGYYGELYQALNGYCRNVMMNYVKDNDVCLLKVLEKIEELKKEIKAYE